MSKNRQRTLGFATTLPTTQDRLRVSKSPSVAPAAPRFEDSEEFKEMKQIRDDAKAAFVAKFGKGKKVEAGGEFLA